MMEELKKASKMAIAMAMDKGMHGADILAQISDDVSIKTQNSKVDHLSVAKNQMLGIRVLKDQRVGMSFSEGLSSGDIEFMVKSAIENASIAKIDACQTQFSLSAPRAVSHDAQLAPEVSELVDLSLQLETLVRKNAGTNLKAIPYNGSSSKKTSEFYLNHHGMEYQDSLSYVSCYTSALLGEGNVSAMDYYSLIGHLLQDLKVEKCVEETLKLTNYWLKASALNSGKYQVVFTPDAFNEFFSLFMIIFNGKAAKDKINPFKEKLGEQVFSDKISLQDIFDYQNSFHISHFDSEGVPRKQLDLIEKGILKNFYHNLTTAKFFNVKSSGHAKRGPSTSLSVGPTNIVFSPGTDNVMTGDFLEVYNMQGLHSGANPISGQFSFAAQGIWYKNGEVASYVKDITVAGNFYDVMKNVVAVGSEIFEDSSKSFFAPKIKFDAFSITGN